MYALSLFTATTALLAGVAAAANETCYAGVKIITARGTFEPQGLGVQAPTVNKILATIPNSNASDVIYPASPYNTSSSVENGTQNALDQINAYGAACPGSKLVIMGYSQGARVVANALDGSSFDGTPDPDHEPVSHAIGENIVAVVLFGDPNYAQQGVNNALLPCPNSATDPRNGSAYTNLGFYTDRIDEYCTRNDSVCCAGGTSWPAHLSYWTDDTADQVTQYVAAKYHAAVGGANATTTTTPSNGSATPAASGTGRASGTAAPTASSTLTPYKGAATGAFAGSGVAGVVALFCCFFAAAAAVTL